MLVLSRRIGEEIVIDEQIRVVVTAVQGDRVRLGICAPATVRVDRQEVHERRSLLSGSQRPVAGDSVPVPVELVVRDRRRVLSLPARLFLLFLETHPVATQTP